MDATKEYHRMQHCEYYQTEACDCLTECSFKEPTEQESQEELLQGIFDMAQGEHWTYKQILEKFTITRKP